VREEALISFKEILERNRKQVKWIGEQKFHGHEGQQYEIQEYVTPAEPWTKEQRHPIG
jgi:hypothetical protein